MKRNCKCPRKIQNCVLNPFFNDLHFLYKNAAVNHAINVNVNSPLRPLIPRPSIGGCSGEGPGTPAGGPNYFTFMQFSAKNLQNNSTYGSWRTPLGKILDPPLPSLSVHFCARIEYSLAGPKGRKVRTPPLLNLFNFHEVFGKNLAK